MRLDGYFSKICDQILHFDPLPTIDNVFSIFLKKKLNIVGIVDQDTLLKSSSNTKLHVYVDVD